MVGITSSVQYALEEFGIHVKYLKDLIPFIGPPLDDSFQEFYGLSKEDAGKAVEYYREYFAPKGIFENEVYPGIPEMLSRLVEAGFTLIVATSKPAVFAKQILEHFGLSDYFSFVGGSELDGTRKRKAEVIGYILETCEIKPQDAIMIGDRKHDIEGAKLCGLESVGIRHHRQRKHHCSVLRLQRGPVRPADPVHQLRRPPMGPPPPDTPICPVGRRLFQSGLDRPDLGGPQWVCPYLHGRRAGYLRHCPGHPPDLRPVLPAPPAEHLFHLLLPVPPAPRRRLLCVGGPGAGHQRRADPRPPRPSEAGGGMAGYAGDRGGSGPGGRPSDPPVHRRPGEGGGGLTLSPAQGRRPPDGQPPDALCPFPLVLGGGAPLVLRLTQLYAGIKLGVEPVVHLVQVVPEGMKSAGQIAVLPVHRQRHDPEGANAVPQAVHRVLHLKEDLMQFHLKTSLCFPRRCGIIDLPDLRGWCLWGVGVLVRWANTLFYFLIDLTNPLTNHIRLCHAGFLATDLQQPDILV